MKAKPKILATGNKMNYADALAFLSSTGLWDSLTVEDREAFARHSQILDTPGGNKLGILIAKRGAEDYLIAKHSPSNN